MKRPSAARHRPTPGTFHRTRHSARRKHVHELRHQIRAAQPLHVRALLHPLSIFLLLIIGVLISGGTWLTAADAYNLTAKVPADPLIDGAIITDPSDSASFTTSPITVSGSCPNNSYVKLSDNGNFSGVAWCVTNTFSIQTSLTAGSNSLVAQDYNVTDDPGPATLPVTVTYTPLVPPAPITPSAEATTPSSSTQAPPSLTVAADYHFQAFDTGSVFSWAISVTGGSTPYTLATSWGDGTKTTTTLPQAGQQTLTHHYRTAGYYPIIVTVVDAVGRETTMQLAALIRLPNATGLSFTVPSAPTDSSFNTVQALMATLVSDKMLLWIAWPTYLVVVLMAVSFWLGERQMLGRRLAVQPVRNKRRQAR